MNSMIKNSLNNYLWIVQLMLGFFILFCSSCGSLRLEEEKFNEVSKPILRVVICEQDYPFFIQKIQELNIKPIDMQMKVNEIEKLFWVTFRFTSKKDFVFGRSEILSTGLVKQIK